MRRQGGFTLIEIVMTIVVLGILAGAAFNASGLAGKRISEILRAEDRVMTELRRARAAALYRLPESDGGEASPVIARIDQLATEAEVSPKEIGFLHPIGEVDSTNEKITITISIASTERCLELISKTGKINEIAC